MYLLAEQTRRRGYRPDRASGEAQGIRRQVPVSEIPLIELVFHKLTDDKGSLYPDPYPDLGCYDDKK